MINPAVDELAEQVGVKYACALLGRPRGSHYRAKKPPVHGPAPKRPTPPNALTPAEQAQVLAVLTSERFCDKSVSQAWATLLDEGTYLCSMSTMHRILRRNDAAGERRRQAVHPAKKKPELLATRSGQVWSWDITKLRGPGRGIWFQLYVVLDIFSRYVVAWTVQACEDSQIAKTMLEEAFGLHGIPDAVHADSKTVACLGAPGFRDSHADRPWGLPWCRRCSRSI
ncbi:DDE-type integrase/transposase/recombinase, partial [Nostocoides vanveenii]|uniref:DDE-type integrase/transposase/recombinase n=1 Tax=Nostocoides vanveenii TaxID=330835 RepID=UPI0031E170F2